MTGRRALANLIPTAAPCCRSSSCPRNAAPSRRSIPTKADFEATSTWRGTASAGASIAYFAHPLRDLLGCLRAALYPHLAGVANTWNGRMGVDERLSGNHAAMNCGFGQQRKARDGPWKA
jgi:hypothetical protein